MAGIKNVYRSPDAFRFPTWDSAISYSVNSVVAFYDSDTSSWGYYISKKQTAAGSLDSDIRYNDWAQFTFDSDTLRKATLLAVQDNFNALEAALIADFTNHFTMLVNNNDSDFKVLQTRWDSDWLVYQNYFDSEIKKSHLDLDSESAAIRYFYNHKIAETDSDVAVIRRNTALRTYTDKKVERAVRIEFADTKKLSRVSPHPDTIAVVKSNKTVYVVHDSEWVLVNSYGFRVAVDSESEFNLVWPPAKFPVGARAVDTSTRWEYVNSGTAWVVDETSKTKSYYLAALTDVQTKQNKLIVNHDSDLAVTKASLAVLAAKNITQDSQILQNSNTYVSLYNRQNNFEDNINTSVAALSTTVNTANTGWSRLNSLWVHDINGLDSDIAKWQTTATANVNATTNALTTKINNAIAHFDVSADSDKLALTQITQNALSNVSNLNTMVTNWRTDELDRFTTANRRMDGFDSDRLADNAKFYSLVMKYRGDIRIDSDLLYPKAVEVGDVYNVLATGIGAASWGVNIEDVTVPINSMVLYTAEKGWVIMNSGSGGQVFESPLSIDNIGVPAGTILTFPNLSAIPASFRLCNGSTYNVVTYAELFQILGSNRVPTLTGTNVVYAIAMYSGAGATRYNYDSDVRQTVTEHDSDISFFYELRKDFDSDISRNRHDIKMRDSDVREWVKVHDSEQDSDINKLRIRLDNLGASAKLVQWSTVFDVAAVGGLLTNTEYDITAEVINTSTPEPYCYPDLEFFYDNQSANAHPTLNGRRLDGQNTTPQITYRIIHDSVGNMTVGMSTSAAVSNDIRIVSTFRIQ